jgi:hypothetical protein
MLLVLGRLDDPDPLRGAPEVVAGAEAHGVDVEDKLAIAGRGRGRLLAVAPAPTHELLGQAGGNILARLAEQVPLPNKLAVRQVEADQAAHLGRDEDAVLDHDRGRVAAGVHWRLPQNVLAVAPLSHGSDVWEVAVPVEPPADFGRRRGGLRPGGSPAHRPRDHQQDDQQTSHGMSSGR